MSFVITWLFDKLGYMPKIKVDVGSIAYKAWPFPVESKAEETPVKKSAVKKTRTLPSRAAIAKTARTKKAK